ncbi:hypothetical protein KP509_33G041500 [Ceratopteris richardii]|uniref:Uncharacterized protein n=1 Tax=Ceratopteris richardii TaxID=49495 RepID=A0A8T2QPC9_CERRI|nr:hypothetical protein KP509_33G041500 [Ceratopteris richardii]
MIVWLLAYDLNISHLPILLDREYALSLFSHSEQNKVATKGIWQVYARQRWILPPKMHNYQEHFMRISEMGFFERPGFLDAYLPCAMRFAISQLWISSVSLRHRGRAEGIPRKNMEITPD